MRYLILYFLAGAIVAVWTAISQHYMEMESEPSDREPARFLLPAYVIIALAWPVSVLVSVYALLTNLLPHGPGN